MNQVIIYNGETGKTFSVMPILTGLSLADWNTLRVAMTEGAAPNAGQYSATVDLTVSLRWGLFETATQPADWSGVQFEFDLTDEVLLAGMGGAGGSIDSTGTETLTMAKAIESIFGYCFNVANRTAAGAAWDYKGRDGTTDIITAQAVPTETDRTAAVITP